MKPPKLSSPTPRPSAFPIAAIRRNSERSRFILLTNRYSGNRPAIQNHQKRRLPDFVGEGNFALEINPLTNETYKQKNRNMGTSDGHAGPLLSVGRSPAPSSACRTSRPARLRMALGKGNGERQHGSRFRHRLSERHELRLLHGRQGAVPFQGAGRKAYAGRVAYRL